MWISKAHLLSLHVKACLSKKFEHREEFSARNIYCQELGELYTHTAFSFIYSYYMCMVSPELDKVRRGRRVAAALDHTSVIKRLNERSF